MTASRAEMLSPFESVMVCRSGPVAMSVDLGRDDFGAPEDLRAHRVDQRVVHDALLVARPLFHQAAEARHPDIAVRRRGAPHCVGEAGQLKRSHLAPSSFSQRKSGG